MSMWELFLGKIRETPRATELVPDPPAAIPVVKEVTANRGIQCSMQVRTRGSFMALKPDSYDSFML